MFFWQGLVLYRGVHKRYFVDASTAYISRNWNGIWKPSFQLDTPTSFTTDLSVAEAFTAGNGCVIGLTVNPLRMMKECETFIQEQWWLFGWLYDRDAIVKKECARRQLIGADVSWISQIGDEKEILIGRFVRIKDISRQIWQLHEAEDDESDANANYIQRVHFDSYLEPASEIPSLVDFKELSILAVLWLWFVVEMYKEEDV